MATAPLQPRLVTSSPYEGLPPTAPSAAPLPAGWVTSGSPGVAPDSGYRPSGGSTVLPPPPSSSPTNPGTFTRKAPTPTPYGAFTAPNPADVANDPYYQFRLSEGSKALQRGAAARGTLLTGGLQKALLGYGQGLASEEGQNIFNRALASYNTNRDTNAQNFGQSMASFQGDLGAFVANTNATLGFDRLGMDAAYGNYDRQYGAAQDAQARQDARNAMNAFTADSAQANARASADDYNRQQAENAARSASILAARRPPPSYLSSRFVASRP